LTARRFFFSSSSRNSVAALFNRRGLVHGLDVAEELHLLPPDQAGGPALEVGIALDRRFRPGPAIVTLDDEGTM
jgi:hypothetical protein